MCLDMGHHKSYDGTKMSYQKRHGGINMILVLRTSNKTKTEKYRKSTGRPLKSMRRRKNSNFTQTYPKGWQRIRKLVRTNRVLLL